MRFVVFDIRPDHPAGIHLPNKLIDNTHFAHRHYRYDNQQHELRILVCAIDMRSYRNAAFLDTSEGIDKVYKLIMRYLGNGSNFVGNEPTKLKDLDALSCHAVVELKNRNAPDTSQRFILGIAEEGMFVSSSDLTVVAFDSASVSDGVIVLMRQFGHTPAEIHNAYQQIHFEGTPSRDENLFVPLIGDTK